MRKIIHNLKQQPEYIKHHVAGFVTIIFGFILVVLWVWGLGGGEPEVVKEESKDSLKPISVLKANLVDGYERISGE
jgi:hypothetical protein